MKVRNALIGLIFLSLAVGVACKGGGSAGAPFGGATAAYPGTGDGAEKMLLDLLHGKDRDAIVESLIPRDDDYAAVFEPADAEKAKAAYTGLWKTAERVEIKPKEGQTELLMWKATTEELRAGTGDSGHFPGGYKDVAMKLKPGVTWYRWKFCKPGETLGMAFDGLVHVNGHWAWFPKPWYALK
ncbi:MAG: hypothetical protein KA419_11045 [Acidobacteria bacterium]|nr:hypothetical protein [Acidobacteriota bacterium]